MASRIFTDIHFPKQPDEVQNIIEELLETDGVEEIIDSNGLIKAHGELREGEFTDTEAYLVKKNIPFDRYTEGGLEFPPLQRCSRPGKMDIEMDINVYGESYLTLDQIKYFMENLTPDQFYKCMEGIMAQRDISRYPITNYIEKEKPANV